MTTAIHRLPYKLAARFRPQAECHCNLSDTDCYAAGHWNAELPLAGPFTAVFNNHVNNAGKRALREVKNRYPASNRHLRTLIRMNRTGIMEIFKVNSTGPSRDYATRVFAYTNGLPLAQARALVRTAQKAAAS